MSVGITKSDVDPTNHYFNGRARDFQRYRFHCYAPLVLFKSLRGAQVADSFPFGFAQGFDRLRRSRLTGSTSLRLVPFNSARGFGWARWG